MCPTLSTYLDCSKPPPPPSSFFLIIKLYMLGGFPGGLGGLSVCLQCRRPRFNPWVGKIPWRRAWQPTPVFLPGESQGQRKLSGYSPWGQKVSDMSEQLSTHMLSIKIQIRNSLILIQMTPGISLDIYFSMLPSKHIQSESEVIQLCPTLCNPMDYSPPGSSVHGIFQARVLEWVAISFSRGSFRPRD